MLADEIGLERSKVPLQTVIDALSAHVAVCDGSGLITAVNSAWRQFADDNDGRLADDGPGGGGHERARGEGAGDRKRAGREMVERRVVEDDVG